MSDMVRLIRVELKRLFRRRAVLILLAACFVVPTIIGVVVALDTRPPSGEELANAQQQLEEEKGSPHIERSIRQCIKKPSEWGVPSNVAPDDVAEQCREMNEPRLEWYLWNQPLDLAQEREDGSGIAISMIVAMALMLLGTTFTGHDWASGSVSNQVLFEPRRLRIWAAKAIAVTGTAFVTAAIVFSGYWLVMNAIAGSRDQPHGGGVLMDCLQMGWRAAGVAALAALAGFALTMLFRSTVATLGILFGIALAGGMLMAVLGIDSQWNPGFNVLAVLTDGVTYDAEIPCPPGEMGDGAYCSERQTISLAQGLTYLGTIIGAACVVSAAAFRRRDIP